MKSRIFFLLITLIVASADVMAGGPLKQPLTFIESDSIIVWGDDRSDFRTTALSAAPELKARHIIVSNDDVKNYKKNVAVWNKELLPQVNILGSLGEIGDKEQLLPTSQMMTQAGKLFLQSADATYLDVVERCALNALMVSLRADEMTFEKHVAAQAMMNVSSMIYATDDVGLFINFYINSSTRIKTDQLNFVIDQLTAMPNSNRVKLRIGGMRKGQQKIVLRLRMPNWAMASAGNEKQHFALEGVPEHLPTVYVNGREEFYHMEHGYLVIDRLWNSGDEVYFDFPFAVRYLYNAPKGKTDYRQVALQRGPLVYGLTEAFDGSLMACETKFIEEDEPNDDAHSMVAATVKVAGDKTQKLEAQPVMDGVKQIWMKNMPPSVYQK